MQQVQKIDETLNWKDAEHRKVVILGSGPAGCSAAVYTARANLNPLVIRGNDAGGQLTRTTDIENYAGFTGTGPELMTLMEEQAKEQGTDCMYGHVIAVDFSKRPFKLQLFPDIPIVADSVIIATGASARYLGIPSEEKYLNAGISGCATCDGPLYRGEEVCVIGGGDVAIEDALFLTRFCPVVHIIHRRNELRASKAMQGKILSNEKIKMEWNSVVDEFLGEAGDLTGVRLKDVETGELREIKVAGAFLAIGHTPNTSLFQGILDLDENGYIKADPGSTYTNIPGIFAAGDVRDKVYRQAITSAGTGCMAALDAERWLAEMD